MGAVKDGEKEKRPNFFTPTQVAAHNTTTDLWVSYLGKVCDLTPLAMQHEDDPLLVPILEFAGKDISSWFDVETKDLQTYIHPLTNCVSYYTPRGRFLHVPPAGPRSDWATDVSPPWWKDERYVVGRLTVKTRWIRVINTLTSQEQRLEVCTEETMEEILKRYLFYNSHASSYTWKFEGTCLDMSRTLCENSIPDQDMELEQLRLDRDLFTPAILLYFNDDLTEG
ncbi:cytochrome b5 domain-containing protein 1 [Synchiropus picturatus]